jgi:hypothetical protein
MMNRQHVIAIALVSVGLVSSSAYAEDECTTTVTTKCTGSAAQMATPAAERGHFPAAPAPAAPATPPAAPAQPAYPLPPQQPYPYQYAPPAIVAPGGSGWTLKYDPEARAYFHERRSTGPNNGLVIGGMILFTGSWIASSTAGLLLTENIYSYIPIAGPIVSAIMTNDGGGAVLYGFAAITQAAGLVMAITGALSKVEKVEKRPVVQFGGGFTNGGGAVQVAGRF